MIVGEATTVHIGGSRAASMPRRVISAAPSGYWRTIPVNLLTHDGRRYLVAPQGETQSDSHYTYGCRCPGCRAAHTSAVRERRELRREINSDRGLHSHAARRDDDHGV
jgi:hypothetical protein